MAGKQARTARKRAKTVTQAPVIAPASPPPPSNPSPKRIICFSDGTGNSAAKLFKTNVYRAYEALDKSRADQIAHYDDGVGSSSFRPLAAIGGVFGYGLARNVRSLYAFICTHYNPGDQIYLFGFSRGAFTVRILAGLIANQGIIPRQRFTTDKELQRLVRWAYRNYRRKYYARPFNGWVKPMEDKSLRRAVRGARDHIIRFWQSASKADSTKLVEGNHRPFNSETYPSGVRVAFLGLWDTVDAYGGPIEEVTKGWDEWIWPISMRDQKPWAGIERICHALALDDERDAFHPRLVDECEGKYKNPGTGPTQSTNIADERITQVWFAGMHSDVGGGYPKDGLSYVSLKWMLRQLDHKWGGPLHFRPEAIKEIEARADNLGHMNDSRAGLGSYYRYQPRSIKALKAAQPITYEAPKIHESVFDRIRRSDGTYAPIVLPADYRVVDGNGNISPPSLDRSLEDTPKAQLREQHQEVTVWDSVWKRRVAYFATVFVTGLIVLLPWFAGKFPKGIPFLGAISEPEKCTSSSLCFLAGLTNLLGAVLPGFAQGWVKAIAANPGIFIVLAAAVYLLMNVGMRLRRKITDQMSALWDASKPLGPINRSEISKFRTDPVYVGFFHFIKRYFLPTSLGILMALVLFLHLPIVALNRLPFAWQDARGEHCKPSLETTEVSGPSVFAAKSTFDGSEVCWASGLKLKAGATYEIVMVMEGEWLDGDWQSPTAKAAADRRWEITKTMAAWFSRLRDTTSNSEEPKPYPADVEGLLQPLPLLVRAIGYLLKRDVSENYFTPIARIVNRERHAAGRAGQDEYVLRPLIPKARGETQTRLVSRIKAASDGELHIYLNDVLIFWGFNAYANNTAKANVTVRRVTSGP